jgi:hypothetical protein
MIDKIQFRPTILTDELESRGATSNATASQLAARDLERYYELLRVALAGVTLSHDEAMFLIDCQNGAINDVFSAQMFASQVADCVKDGMAEKWGIKALELINRIAGWSLLQRMAVIDAIERAWANDAELSSDLLVAIGLVKRH